MLVISCNIPRFTQDTEIFANSDSDLDLNLEIAKAVWRTKQLGKMASSGSHFMNDFLCKRALGNGNNKQ